MDTDFNDLALKPESGQSGEFPYLYCRLSDIGGLFSPCVYLWLYLSFVCEEIRIGQSLVVTHDEST